MADETRVTVTLTVDVDEDELSLDTAAVEDAVTELVGPGVSGELRLDVRRTAEGPTDPALAGPPSDEPAAARPADPTDVVEHPTEEDDRGSAERRPTERSGEPGGSDDSSNSPESTGLADSTESGASSEEDGPGPAPADPPTGETKARFEVYEDRAGQFRWRLVHDNGNVIADSGEGYSTWAGAENGLRSVKRNAPGAAVERL